MDTISPDDAAPPRPAAPLHATLTSALEEARFEAQVSPGADDSALDLTVYSSKAPWQETTPEAASAWLAENGLAAEVSLNDGYCIVITLYTARAVEKFIAVALDPWMRAHTTATQLADVLDAHGLTFDVDVSAHFIEVALADANLHSAVKVAALLSAPGIADGLNVHRPRGVRRLADRVRWLLTGVVGSEVDITADPGCAHVQEHLTLRATIDQARRLTQRLLHAPHSG
ncbi:hypothetical protein KBP30_00375 [Streptomyces sp. Go40/10]|uniref:hypothetical protein n=1 Tax=Streptomyces sp. Go40/10 TaxID=2825844 RepID=UPI001E51C269|nr:hypothetical protein [Streptomyces sp. Go40/10]UFQ99786.1 hypothetical protein KBP30_00375 [Streptomyces sp. Go40/10]